MVHTFMSVFISFAAAISGQFHRDDASLSPALTQQPVSISSQKTTKLQAPPPLVPPKSEKSSPTLAGDHPMHLLIFTPFPNVLDPIALHP